MRAVADRAVRAFLDDGATLCFTTDIEWSPEWAIAATFELADGYGVPLTPFLTHRSAYLEHRLADPRQRRNAGVHPNFLPGSTHGGTVDEVIAVSRELLPGAVSFRAHCFYDDTRTLRKLAGRGFRYDSNACAFLQTRLVPMRTVTDILRFPVFWEDDVHSAYGLEWSLESIREAITAPGLKIVNVHPLRVALNVPDEAFRTSEGGLYEARGVEDAYDGRGTRTMLEDLLGHATTGGRGAVTFDALYDRAIERGFALTAS